METINDIVREMRTVGRLDEKSTDNIPRSLQALGLRIYADRIEAAVKALEADRDNWRRQALDEDARANATHKDSLAVGDMAAMREALSDACYAMFNFLKTQYGSCYEEMAKALDKAKSVLAKPPRNCDVGTAKKQSLRFEDFCNLHRSCKKGCSDCPLLNCEPSCEFEWANMPYGKGATHEQ